MNPCRCGLAGEPSHSCARGARCAADYQARLSGPFLDRIDIGLEVPAITVVDLIKPSAAESSSAVAERVASARDLQRQRFLAPGSPEVVTNAQCAPGQLDEIAQADSAALSLLRDAAESMRLSARGYHRVLKIARTLADLDSSQNIGRLHLAEALSFRVAGARTALAA